MIAEAIKWGFRKVGLDVHKLYQPPENRFKWLQEFNIRTIIDVGANRGQFAFMIQPFFPEAVIYCFEPQRDVAARLENRAHKAGIDDRLVVFGVGLGNFNGLVKINRAVNTTDTSLLKMTDYFMGIYKSPSVFVPEEVMIRRLDDLRFKIWPELMVKIDVEGYESQVLRGAERTLAEAKVLYIEVTFLKERYGGQPLFDELYSRVRAMGFECAGFSQTYFHYRTGAPYYADAVFIRK